MSAQQIGVIDNGEGWGGCSEKQERKREISQSGEIGAAGGAGLSFYHTNSAKVRSQLFLESAAASLLSGVSRSICYWLWLSGFIDQTHRSCRKPPHQPQHAFLPRPLLCASG